MSILYSREQDGTLNVLIAGKVIREPELKETKNGNKIRFSVAYGKSKFMNVECWADSSVGEMAGRLEKGDSVIVTGLHNTWEYNGKQYSKLEADFIQPMMAGIADAALEPAHAAPQRTVTAPKNAGKAVNVSTDDGWEELDDDEGGELPF